MRSVIEQCRVPFSRILLYSRLSSDAFYFFVFDIILSAQKMMDDSRSHIRFNEHFWFVERKDAHRIRCVLADARDSAQRWILMWKHAAVFIYYHDSCIPQIFCTSVVTKPAPFFEDFGQRRFRQCANFREFLMNDLYFSITRGTWVCCNITSETRILY